MKVSKEKNRLLYIVYDSNQIFKIPIIYTKLFFLIEKVSLGKYLENFLLLFSHIFQICM